MKFYFVLNCFTLFWKQMQCTNVTTTTTTAIENSYDYDYSYDYDEPETRIIGGFTANIQDFPYVVQLNLNNVRICGGSIIKSNWILTAAHCTYGHKKHDIKIRVGTSFNAKGGVVIKAKEKKEHPKYDNTYLDYDVAVVKLVSSIPGNIPAKKVHLPEVKAYPEPGHFATVVGWGILREKSLEESDELQAVYVPIITLKVCSNWYYSEKIKSYVICAGYKSGRKDACVSDSGGPLAIKNIQYGIVSWGIGCARPMQPGVYTSTAHPAIRNFIRKVTGV